MVNVPLWLCCFCTNIGWMNETSIFWMNRKTLIWMNGLPWISWCSRPSCGISAAKRWNWISPNLLHIIVSSLTRLKVGWEGVHGEMQWEKKSCLDWTIKGMPAKTSGAQTQILRRLLLVQHPPKMMDSALNKLAKLGDAIAISNLKLPITDPLTDWLTGVGARRCYRI